MATVDPRDEQITRLEAQLAEALRLLSELRAQHPASAVAPPEPEAPVLPGETTLELTLHATSAPASLRVVATWTRPDHAAVRRECAVQLDLDALANATPEAYGVILGHSLFDGELHALMGDVIADRRPFRVLLVVEAERLQVLRWDRLCIPTDSNRWTPLARHPKATFSLHTPAPIDRRFRDFGRGALKALVVVASPEAGGEGVAHFDEEAALQAVLAGLGDDIPARVLGKSSAAAGPPTLTELCCQLAAERFTLLHVVAHGAVDAVTGEALLYLDGDDGRPTPVRASELVEQLQRLGDEEALPHVAFLSTCAEASQAAEGALAATARQLVRLVGMPATVAVTTALDDDAARVLSCAFYPALRAHGEVDRAVADALRATRSGEADGAAAATYTRLGARPVFAEVSDIAPGEEEIRGALARLDGLFARRAPTLRDDVLRAAARVGATLGHDAAPGTDQRRERERGLDELDRACVEVLELPFASLARGVEPAPYDPRCPFPGLRAFAADTRWCFRGRDGLVDALVAWTDAAPLLVVMGASGSGRTSCLGAGVVPTLAERDPELAVAWLAPGVSPRVALATALTALGEAPRTLLVVDPFEEVFARCDDPDERAAFIDALVARASSRHRVVLSMRADYLGDCAAHPALREAVERHAQLVAPMTPDALVAAALEQAETVGLRFEAGLAERMLHDLAGVADAMPMLQHALRELWERRRGRWLRLDAYVREVEGVRGAVALTADRVHDALDDRERTRLRVMMRRLVRVEGPHGDVARRVSRAALCDDATSEALLARLAGAGAPLLTVTTTDEVALAHESLVRLWPRLGAWLDEARYALAEGRRVKAAAWAWREGGDAAALLEHRGARGEVVRTFALRGLLELDGEQATYLQACADEDARRDALTAGDAQRAAAALAAQTARADAAEAQAAESAEQRARLEEETQRLGETYLEAHGRLLTSYEEQGRYAFLAGDAEHALLCLHVAWQAGRRETATRFVLARASAALVSSPYLALEGHEARVVSASFSADGRRLVTAGEDDTARVWDAETGELLTTLHGHENTVRSAMFSPDGTRVVTASNDATGELWNASDWTSLGVLEGHEEEVNTAVFSADSTRVATASLDRTARVWDAASGAHIVTLEGHAHNVWTVCFSADGTRVLTGSVDRTARLWNAVTGEALHTLVGHEGTVWSARFSPDGTRVLTASEDGTARLWNAATGAALALFAGHARAVVGACFSPDGARVLTASDDGTARMWDATTGKLLATLRGHHDGVQSAAFSADGARVVTASHDRTVRLWNARRGICLAVLRGHAGGVSSALFHPDGLRVLSVATRDAPRVWTPATTAPLAVLDGHAAELTSLSFHGESRLLTASDDGTARLWDVTTGQAVATLTGHEAPVASARFSPDGARVVTAGVDGTARLWDAATGDVSATLSGHEGPLAMAVFRTDGLRVLTASVDGTARLWDAATGAPLVTLRGHEGPVHAVAFRPDGLHLVTTGDDATVRMWHAVTGDALLTLQGHEEPVWWAEYAPDGRRFVTAGMDGTARLWEAGGAPGPVLLGHTGAVFAARFSPDGTRVLTAGSDGTARLWEATTGVLLSTLRGHGSEVGRAVFSADGALVATVCSDRVARVWDAVTGALLAAFDAHAERVWHVAFSADGSRLATGSDDGAVCVWDVSLEGRDAEALEAFVRAHRGRADVTP